MPLNSISDVCEFTENVLNKVGYIPLIGTISGLIRFKLGLFQVWAGLLVFLFSLCATAYWASQNLYKRQGEWATHTKSGILHFGHGWLNMGRAFLEFVPFVSLVTCFPYDRSGVKILRYEEL